MYRGNKKKLEKEKESESCSKSVFWSWVSFLFQYHYQCQLCLLSLSRMLIISSSLSSLPEFVHLDIAASLVPLDFLKNHDSLITMIQLI